MKLAHLYDLKPRDLAKKIINEIMTNVRSGFSYSGARSIKELQELAVFAQQTSLTHKEGNPHIFNRR